MPDRDRELVPVDHFVQTYDEIEPRAYFRSLAPLGYRQPAVIAAYLARAAGTISRCRRTTRLRILDFACGYGVVGCLLQHDLTMDDLYARFVPEVGARAGARGDDRRFYAARRTDDLHVEVGGLDVARNAIVYALDHGLIDDGFVEDLTVADPSDDLVAFMAECDLIVETGAVYSTAAACYDRLLEAAGDARPWILCGPRGDADTRALWPMVAERGYRIEVCSRHRRRYRRVVHDAEWADAARIIRATGRDPADHLVDGWFVNDLVLARPESDAAALPIDELRF